MTITQISPPPVIQGSTCQAEPSTCSETNHDVGAEYSPFKDISDIVDLLTTSPRNSKEKWTNCGNDSKKLASQRDLNLPALWLLLGDWLSADPNIWLTLVKVRFLRARKFSVSKAFTMFSESEQWRKEFKIEELVKSFKFEENPQVSAYYPRYYHKTDRVTNSMDVYWREDGRPIYIEQLGKIDVNALFEITTQERLLQNLIVEAEKLERQRFVLISILSFPDSSLRVRGRQVSRSKRPAQFSI